MGSELLESLCDQESMRGVDIMVDLRKATCSFILYPGSSRKCYDVDQTPFLLSERPVLCVRLARRRAQKLYVKVGGHYCPVLTDCRLNSTPFLPFDHCRVTGQRLAAQRTRNERHGSGPD